jgi:mono/diheme cytochrome c family protein
VRRLVPILVGCMLLLTACGGAKTVAPVPQTVEGTIPKQQAVKGNAAAGKAVFASQGCASCHTYAPAGAHGKIGPDLGHLASDAAKANQGSLEEYTKTSITDPNAYVVPGFTKGVMPSFSGLSPQQLADLVAFLTQKS